MTRISGLVLLLAAAVIGPSCRATRNFDMRRVAVDEYGGGDGALSPDGNSLLLSSHRGGSWDLWRFDIRHSKWDQLTDDPADELEGQWSPDGTRVAYTATKYGNKDLFVLNLAGGPPIRLTTDPEDDEYPAWSPDGKSLVYTGGAWNHRDFFLIQASGGTPRKITRTSGKAGACSFHPDGRHVICHRFDSGTGNVWSIALDDGYETPVTAGRFWDYKPAFSPDGKWLAFSRSEEGPSEIRIMPAGGGDPKPIARAFADDRWPSWSRDSSSVMFHRLIDRGLALRILDRRTGEIRTVADETESPGQGSLAPDGRSVVYSAIQDGRQILRVRDLAGGALRTINSCVGDSVFPRWSPDGGRIAFACSQAGHWDVATISSDGSGFQTWTGSLRTARSLNGPLDWSPDSRRIVFHASTQPFEADIYVLDTGTGQTQNVTSDAWFSEAPAFTPDGNVAFMSTRGGNWTWGFFQLSLPDRKVSGIAAAPDYTEKNFLRFGRDGWMAWSAYGDDGVEYIVERSPAGAVSRNAAAGRWARWPSYSSDGRHLLYTTVEHRVEYWIASNVTAPDSPLFKPQSKTLIQTRSRGTADCGRLEAETRMSPLKMHHR